jgi:hypothetical protein
MKKATFDWVEASKCPFDEKKYEEARRCLKQYENLLRSYPAITGYWIGWKCGEPYIMVAIERGKCPEPDKLLPDKLGKYEVYYIEGTFRLF